MTLSRFFVPLIVFASLSCGPAPRPRRATDADLKSLTEARAIELIGQELSKAGITPTASWSIGIASTNKKLDVDLRLGATFYGVEWVSAQDRADFGDAIPSPDPAGQLRILPGVTADAQAQVLVVDHRSYRFDPDAERVRRGSPGMGDTEGRLQRDVRDFLEYVRGQGALPQ